MKTIEIEDDEVYTNIIIDEIIAFTKLKSKYNNELLIVTTSSDFYFYFSDKKKLDETIKKLEKELSKR